MVAAEEHTTGVRSFAPDRSEAAAATDRRLLPMTTYCPRCESDITDHVDELDLETEGDGAYDNLQCPACRAGLLVEYTNGITVVTVQ